MIISGLWLNVSFLLIKIGESDGLKEEIIQRSVCGIMHICPQNQSFIKSIETKVEDTWNHIKN